MLARTTTTRAQTRTATGGIASRLTRACRTSAHTRRCARVMASTAAPASNSYLLLTLHYVDGMLEKRGPHREATSRSAQDMAIEFLKIEEEALAEEPLPLSRRQQVLRYFTALRRQLVEREPSE